MLTAKHVPGEIISSLIMKMTLCVSSPKTVRGEKETQLCEVMLKQIVPHGRPALYNICTRRDTVPRYV